MRLLIALLLLSAQAWGATWYVRPAEDGEYGTEDGTSFVNAFDGESDVVWGGMNPGDTLVLCGEFNYTSAGATHTWVMAASGNSASNLVVDGDCSNQGDLSRAKLINTSTRVSAFATDTQTYVTVQNLEISGFTTRGVWLCDIAASACTQTVVRNVTARGLYIHDINGNAGASPTAVRLGGRNITVTDSVLANCGDDCVYGQGKNNTLSYLTISNPGLDTITGDCIGYNGEVDGLVISNWTCAHPEDEKQCVVVSGPTDSGRIKILSGDCSLPVGGTAAFGIYTEAAADIAGNFVRGGLNGIHVYGSYGDQSIRGNIVIDTTGHCFGTGYGSLSTDARFIDNSGRNCGNYGIALNTNSTLSSAKNNAISGATECYWEYNASSTEEYNALANCPTTVTTGNGHTPGTAGTGTITATPGWVGGTSPTTADGFCLEDDSALLGAGTYIGAWIRGYGGENLTNPPPIGARGLCNARATASARRTVRGTP